MASKTSDESGDFCRIRLKTSSGTLTLRYKKPSALEENLSRAPSENKKAAVSEREYSARPLVTYQQTLDKLSDLSESQGYYNDYPFRESKLLNKDDVLEPDFSVYHFWAADEAESASAVGTNFLISDTEILTNCFPQSELALGETSGLDQMPNRFAKFLSQSDETPTAAGVPKGFCASTSVHNSYHEQSSSKAVMTCDSNNLEKEKDKLRRNRHKIHKVLKRRRHIANNFPLALKDVTNSPAFKYGAKLILQGTCMPRNKETSLSCDVLETMLHGIPNRKHTFGTDHQSEESGVSCNKDRVCDCYRQSFVTERKKTASLSKEKSAFRYAKKTATLDSRKSSRVNSSYFPPRKYRRIVKREDSEEKDNSDKGAEPLESTQQVDKGEMTSKFATLCPPAPASDLDEFDKHRRKSSDVEKEEFPLTSHSEKDSESSVELNFGIKRARKGTRKLSIQSSVCNSARNSKQTTNVSTRRTKRPKRTPLPEDAVAFLQCWLCEHISNPYPTWSEKLSLMSSSGLKLTQIDNWLANTRSKLKIQKRYRKKKKDIKVCELSNA